MSQFPMPGQYPVPSRPQLPRPGGQPGRPLPGGQAPVARPAQPQVARPQAPIPGTARPGTQPVAPRPAGVPGAPAAQVDPAPPPAPAPGPASTPAPNAPAPGAPTQGVPAPGTTVPGGGAAPGVQAPAAPIGTPATATSQPLGDSPWEYEKMWGALGALGDSDLDAAVKGATMEGLRDNPFSKGNLARANTTEFEKGMGDLAGTRSGLEADMVRRGLSDTGLASELGAEAEMAARAGIAGAQRQNTLDFAEKGAAVKRENVQMAQNLAKDLASRGVDIENLRMQREQLAQQLKQQRAAGGGGGSNTIEIMNPDGSMSEVPLDILDMVLNMGEGGYDYDE